MNRTEQFPLSVDLLSPSQGESMRPIGVTDVCEHRLHRSHPATVVMTTSIGVEPLDHRLDGGLGMINDGDVLHLGLLPTDAFLAQ